MSYNQSKGKFTYPIKLKNIIKANYEIKIIDFTTSKTNFTQRKKIRNAYKYIF